MATLSDHPEYQKPRALEKPSSKHLIPTPEVKPPREVSVRVKFIRLGEVSLFINKFIIKRM